MMQFIPHTPSEFHNTIYYSLNQHVVVLIRLQLHVD